MRTLTAEFDAIREGLTAGLEPLPSLRIVARFQTMATDNRCHFLIGGIVTLITLAGSLGLAATVGMLVALAVVWWEARS